MSKELEKLEERKKQIEAKIKEIKSKENAKKKKDETRKKILVGAMVLAQVERGEWPESRLKEAMDKFLDRERDRILFGLPEKPTQNELEKINASKVF